nr:hypothetical protein CFP56_73998 [Quercus suber]
MATSRDGMYKTNYDGAIFAKSKEVGIGVLVRYVKGDVIAALVEKIPYLGSVEVSEALAARRVAKFVVELGLSGSEFEGDSMVVWRALKSANEAHSFIEEIIKDTMSIVGSYAWQSILKARPVVQKGMLWRIGDGSRVRVFHDKWIPGVFPLKAAAQNQEFVDDSTVSSLINVETGMEWAFDRSINLPLAGLAYKSHYAMSDLARRLYCLATKQGWQLLCENRVSEKIGMLAGGVEVLEVMAARRAIRLAVELGFQKCIIEGDSEIVLKALTEDVSVAPVLVI